MFHHEEREYLDISQWTAISDRIVWKGRQYIYITQKSNFNTVWFNFQTYIYYLVLT